MRSAARLTLILLLGLLAPQPLWADASVDVDIGWGDRARVGGWTPVFIRVSDAKARNATMQLRAPHDSSSTMEVIQPIAIGPSPQTYVLYVPMIYSYGEPLTLLIKDAATGKTLFDHALIDRNSGDSDPKYQNLFHNSPGNLFIGVSGRKNGMGALDSGSISSSEVVFLHQEYLPEVAKGLESLDVLFLNQPDFSALRPAQQSAIADWVRAGGHLIVAPSEDPIPPGSPLVKMLPCSIGDVTTITASLKNLRSARLPERFAKFKARALLAGKDATSIPLLGSSGAVAVRAARGLGHVSVVSFDTSDLMFDSSDGPRIFWDPVLDVNHSGILTRGTSGNAQQVQDPQRAAAAGQVIDLLGNVPGVGSFGFKYVAMVLLAMMVIVGPIDWFVLKKMGRQQWTWFTTLGWIGLITTGAIFIGSIFRSGDLHYRTLQVVDQVDGAAVARTDVIGIYSPKTDDYHLDVPPGGWWEPISTDQYSYGRGVMKSLVFIQDGRSGANVPADMTVNVWNLRFLSSEIAQKGNPGLSTALSLKRDWISGTITNLSDSTLTHLWLRMSKLPNISSPTMDLTKLGDWPAKGLAPKATLHLGHFLRFDTDKIDGPSSSEAARPERYGRYGQHISAAPTDDLGIVEVAGELSMRRTRAFQERMNQVGTRDEAIVYALSDRATSAVKLADHQAIEKHWLVIRALVPIQIVP